MEPTVTSPIPVLGMHHVALNCGDLAAQERFYCELLGFRRVAVFRQGTPKEFIMLQLGASYLELFPRRVPGGEGGGGEQAIGFKHMAFEVGNLDDAMGALARRELVVDATYDWSEIMPGFRLCFFRDPEGNIVELLEGFRAESGGK